MNTPYEYFLNQLPTKLMLLSDDDHNWSQEEFISHIEHISILLSKKNLTPGARVGVALGKTVYQVATMLAIWKNDLVYVPISKKNPTDRVQYIVENCELSLLLDDPKVLSTSETLELSSAKSPTQNLSYIIYTSGTTGMPKGVVIENSSVSHFYQAILKEKFPLLENKEIILQMVDFSFDISIWDLGLWFIYGGKLVITDFESNALKLIKTMTEHNVTIMTAAAPAYAILMSAKEILKRFDFSTLKLLITSASYCPPKVALEVLDTFNQATLYNAYGPTEGTVYCTWTKIVKEQINLSEPLSIGHLLWGMGGAFYLNEKVVDCNQMADGLEAELIISGPQLFLKYWKSPELTSEKTLFDNGKRYYRTGDLITKVGENFYYHGRIDDTIKVNGHRVNLGEIEICTSELSFIAHSIVVEKVNEKLQTELFLFYTLNEKREDFHQVEIEMKNQWNKKLPVYMHPKKAIRLDHFPLSIAGKINKKELKLKIESGNY
ncbi:MAG: AMP-binding protein [Bacteriovoracaceae bacterium]